MIDEQMLMSVSNSPSIGALRIGMKQDRSAPALSVGVQPAPEPVISPVVEELRLLRHEIIGLRADLASRTIASRLSRAWAWARRQFVR